MCNLTNRIVAQFSTFVKSALSGGKVYEIMLKFTAKTVHAANFISKQTWDFHK